MSDKYAQYDEYDSNWQVDNGGNRTGRPGGYDDEDVFGHEEGHQVCR